MQLAAISLETLNQWMERYTTLKGEELTQKQALFLIGFDITKKIETRMQLFRCQKTPSKVKEGLVIKGYLRNRVKSLDEKGKIVYTNIPHPLSKLYEECAVVTGNAHLTNLIDILEVGDYDPNNPKSRKVI
jgi:hypothetical protein